MAVLDANGDGLDDIAIGAPLHSNPMDKYETGRVYVVYQNEAVSAFQKEIRGHSQTTLTAMGGGGFRKCQRMSTRGEGGFRKCHR